MNFANVTDIKIPNGNVIKIEETDTGRVLWEKNAFEINPVWQSTSTRLFYQNDYNAHPIRFIARGATTDYGALYLFATSADYLDSATGTYNWATDEAHINGVIYAGYYQHTTDNDKIRFIAVSKDVKPNTYNNQKQGLIIYHSDIRKTCNFLKLPNARTMNYESFDRKSTSANKLEINMTSPPTNRVYITLAEDRDEFLITGLSGTQILPINFNSSTPIVSGGGVNLLRTCRVPDLGLYFAANNTRDINYSEDGISWSFCPVFTSGTVLGVGYAGVSKKLCAINASNSEIALSTDGMTWNVKNAPFTNAKAFDYSADYDIFCVIDNKGAYLTRNFSKWIFAPQSNNFTDLLYTRDGIFVAHQDGGNSVYFLFTDNVLGFSYDLN